MHFPSHIARRKFYQKKGEVNCQDKLYGNPSDWIHYRIKNLSLDFFKKYLNFKKNAKVLDIGCAEGLYLFQISHQISQGIGLDIASNKIKKACLAKFKNKNKNLRFFTKDFLNYQGEQGFFDLIFSIESLEHIPYIEKNLKKIKRLLKPKGIFICSVPTPKDIFVFKKKDWRQASGHLYHWSKRDFKKLLNRVSLNVLENWGIGNFVLQVSSSFFYLFNNQIKKIKVEIKGKDIRTKTEEKNEGLKREIRLSRGGEFLNHLDGILNFLPFFRDLNAYNIFICQKEKS